MENYKKEVEELLKELSKALEDVDIEEYQYSLELSNVLREDEEVLRKTPYTDLLSRKRKDSKGYLKVERMKL